MTVKVGVVVVECTDIAAIEVGKVLSKSVQVEYTLPIVEVDIRIKEQVDTYILLYIVFDRSILHLRPFRWMKKRQN